MIGKIKAMSKLRILVDMDDVMENFGDAWVEAINKIYDTPIRVPDLTCWDTASIFRPYIKEPEDIFRIIETEEFWTSVRPLPGASECLKELQSQGCEIIVVTASCSKSYRYKVKHVMERYFPFIPETDIITTHHKDMIIGDVIIDDAPHNLVGNDTPKVKLMMDRPYNQNIDLESNHIYRVHDWEEIYEVISTYRTLNQC